MRTHAFELKQDEKCVSYHMCFTNLFAHLQDLATELLEMFTARKMGKVFFTNSGSEANDSQVWPSVLCIYHMHFILMLEVWLTWKIVNVRESMFRFWNCYHPFELHMVLFVEKISLPWRLLTINQYKVWWGKTNDTIVRLRISQYLVSNE